MHAASRTHSRIEIVEASQIGDARRRSKLLAEQAGMSEEQQNNVAIVASELATNLVNHAKDGALLLRAADGNAGVELIALDKGPGMADLQRCLADGHSTRGTPGNGFGAIRRLSAEFDIWSEPSGTAIVARVGEFPRCGTVAIGGVCVPLRGQQRCGDTWTLRESGETLNLLVVDGLGHGVEAAEAADDAVESFAGSTADEPRELLEQIHVRLRGTRGGAVAVAALKSATRAIGYCGVGNISARIDGPAGTRGMVSSNGIVGGQYRRSETFNYEWPSGSIVVLHSDGLQTRWDLSKYPGLRNRHPALIAAVLYRDFARAHDDVTVLVVSAS